MNVKTDGKIKVWESESRNGKQVDGKEMRGTA